MNSSDLAKIAAADARIGALLPETDRAARIEREQSAAPNGPLRDVLFGVKDVFRVDGLSMTAGSALPPTEFVGPEASAVSLLKAAGAVVLGMTVSAEFAFAEPGATRNPRNVAHTPGGSSSGSAAAVAAGYCELALGSQTIGSVVRPAAYCGVVGFKPSYGRISTVGMVPVAESFDTVGLFASNVSLVARAASVLCASWRHDAFVERPVLGIPVGKYLDQASAEALRVLDGLDAVRVPLFGDPAALFTAHYRLMVFEMARHHARWFPRLAERYRPRTRAAIVDGLSLTEREIAPIRSNRATLRENIHAAMEISGVDVWVCPAATGPAPKGLETTGDPAMQVPWTHAGLPSITLPWCTAKNGMPLGLQLVGRYMDDERLLEWATQLTR